MLSGKIQQLTPGPPSLPKERGNAFLVFSPFSLQEKVRSAMPRFFEASGAAIPQSGGVGDEFEIFQSYNVSSRNTLFFSKNFV